MGVAMLLGMPPTGIEECTLHILRLDNLVNVYVFLHTARYGTTLSSAALQIHTPSGGKGVIFRTAPKELEIQMHGIRGIRHGSGRHFSTETELGELHKA